MISSICGFVFRFRWLTITSLILGCISIFTMYCAPFSIAVGVYGLIVMFNREVAEAYQLVSQGYTANEVKDYYLRGLPLRNIQ